MNKLRSRGNSAARLGILLTILWVVPMAQHALHAESVTPTAQPGYGFSSVNLEVKSVDVSKKPKGNVSRQKRKKVKQAIVENEKGKP